MALTALLLQVPTSIHRPGMHDAHITTAAHLMMSTALGALEVGQGREMQAVAGVLIEIDNGSPGKSVCRAK